MLFAELSMNLIHEYGITGMIVPTGILTDYGCKEFFNYIVHNKTIISAYDFENSKPFFPGVNSRFKFTLLTMGRATTPYREYLPT
jgi:hypothetical protein